MVVKYSATIRHRCSFVFKTAGSNCILIVTACGAICTLSIVWLITTLTHNKLNLLMINDKRTKVYYMIIINNMIIVNEKLTLIRCCFMYACHLLPSCIMKIISFKQRRSFLFQKFFEVFFNCWLTHTFNFTNFLNHSLSNSFSSIHKVF